MDGICPDMFVCVLNLTYNPKNYTLYIVVQQFTTVSLTWLPVLKTLYKPMPMHESNNSQKISALYIQRQLFNPLTTGELALTAAQNIGTMTSQPLVVSGKPLNIISIPQITSCTSATAAVGPVYAAPGTDTSIPTVIPTDNVTGNNADYILNSLFTISNFKVISSNGQVYPSNNPIIQYGSTWSDSYNFQNSFVQTMGFNPSGADSNSTLTFNQYKNYFKAVITDISNDTDDSYNNNCTYNVSFDLWNIADIKIGKSIYFPLEQDSIDILQSLGAEYKGKLKMTMAAMIGANVNKRESLDSGMKNLVQVGTTWYKYEPIFVFYKK